RRLKDFRSLRLPKSKTSEVLQPSITTGKFGCVVFWSLLRAPAMKKLLAVVALCLCAAVPWLQDTASQDKPAAPPTLEALLKQLDHKDVEVRVQAMMELAEFGPKAAPALKRLLAA